GGPLPGPGGRRPLPCTVRERHHPPPGDHCVRRPMPDSQPKREINIRKEYLKLIIDGVKTVEIRVGYPRMRSIQLGQELTFVSGDQRVPTTVKRVTEYPSFEEMLDREDARSIGGDLGESRENLLAVIKSIYPPEKERLGVLAIEIELAR